MDTIPDFGRQSLCAKHIMLVVVPDRHGAHAKHGILCGKWPRVTKVPTLCLVDDKTVNGSRSRFDPSISTSSPHFVDVCIYAGILYRILIQVNKNAQIYLWIYLHMHDITDRLNSCVVYVEWDAYYLMCFLSVIITITEIMVFIHYPCYSFICYLHLFHVIA